MTVAKGIYGARGGRPDRRRFKRVSLHIPVQIIDAHGREFSGELLNLSGGGALVVSTARLKYRESVSVYTSNLGRLAGDIARMHETSFAMRIQAPALKRERLVDALTWLVNEKALGLSDDRRAERRPGEGLASALLGDGRELHCQVIDISATGIALSTVGPRPPVGEAIQIGRAVGRVARWLENGFAVEFNAGTVPSSVHDPVSRF